jgi:hypothetical protein
LEGEAFHSTSRKQIPQGTFYTTDPVRSPRPHWTKGLDSPQNSLFSFLLPLVPCTLKCLLS